VGSELSAITGVHAVTDVTGFGLLGHMLEMCRASAVQAKIRIADVPILEGAAALAQAGIGTGAAARNWASYGNDVMLPDRFADWRRGLLCDPQTSGGLLISVAPSEAAKLLQTLRTAGFAQACIVGAILAGPPFIGIV
jgi:selenide,water dikinase